jgi:hypothetical protein
MSPPFIIPIVISLADISQICCGARTFMFEPHRRYAAATQWTTLVETTVVVVVVKVVVVLAATICPESSATRPCRLRTFISPPFG